MVKITFPDGTVKEYESGVTALEAVAKDIGEGLAKAAVAAKFNGEIIDLTRPITTDGDLTILTFKDEEGKEIFRHSASHVLAIAVKRLFPKAKITIGPAVEDGFYYDIDSEVNFTPEDLEKLTTEMKKIVKENLPFVRKEVSKDEALKILKGNEYKTEMINDIEDETITLYSTGDEFVDFCRGPHVPSTSRLKALKLTTVSGAFWRGDSKNKQLQRIYGTAFPSKDELKTYLKNMEEAQKRDHNKLGRELGLFITSDVVGQGLPHLTPKGAKMIQILQRWIEDEEEKRGYSLTKTPFMAKKELYEISGHWQHYRENMFQLSNAGEEMALRPMTCPFQFMIYKSKSWSYKELPIRYNETATLFRNEATGALHGLIRIRQFTLSEGHILCTMDQLEDEFEKVLDLIAYVMKTLGLNDYWYRFSKWDPKDKDKYIDNPEGWESSQKMLKNILDKHDMKYEEAEGEAAFYGPKLDIQMKNVWGREDTIITVQIDFALPGRYQLKYIDQDNSEKEPVIIHRSSIGCYERTLALLIEHYAGKFPLWISPVQVKILPIADRHLDYCKEVKAEVEEAGLRVEINEKAETTNKKVREAQLENVNYILVVGDKEIEAKTVNVRTRDNEVQGEKAVKDFVKELVSEASSRK